MLTILKSFRSKLKEEKTQTDQELRTVANNNISYISKMFAKLEFIEIQQKDGDSDLRDEKMALVPFSPHSWHGGGAAEGNWILINLRSIIHRKTSLMIDKSRTQ